MAKARYGRKQTNPLLKWGYMVFFGLVTLWLLISIITQQSPTNVLSSFFSKLPNPVTKNQEMLLIEKDSIIASLEEKLEACAGTTKFKRGMVIIDSETMNMRSKPSLISDIVMRIPANAEVEVMFYDTETFFLDSKAGKWCKIRYAGTEGWAWGNFIEEVY